MRVTTKLISQSGWAYRLAQADMNDVKNCDGIFAIVNGTPPNEGVMIELGIAIACGKAILLFRDDFRRCTNSEHYPLNLMLFCGLPEVGWEDYILHFFRRYQVSGKSFVRLVAQ